MEPLDIRPMTDRKKSMLLAKTMDLEIVEDIDGETLFAVPESWDLNIDYAYDFYDPFFMALAWQVHMWMINSEIDKRESPYKVSPKPYVSWWEGSVPWLNEDVQEKLLDKIIELIIEA